MNVENYWIDIKETESLVSKRIIRAIGTKCECGYPLLITDTLRFIKCSNDRCVYSLVENLKKYISIAMGSSISQLEMRNICKDKGYILDIVMDDGLNSIITSKCGVDLRECSLSLGDILYIVSNNTLNSVAYNLTSGFDSVEEFYETIKKGQILYIKDILGYSDSLNMVAVKIYNELLKVEDIIKRWVENLKIKKLPQDILRIAIDNIENDYINCGINKEEFGNMVLRDKRFVIYNIIDERTDILISDKEISRMVNRADEINNKNMERLINQGQLVMTEVGIKLEDGIRERGRKITIIRVNDFLEHLEKGAYL